MISTIIIAKQQLCAGVCVQASLKSSPLLSSVGFVNSYKTETNPKCLPKLCLRPIPIHTDSHFGVKARHLI